MAAEPDITLASTTETQDELDHAVGPNWRQPFDPDKVVEKKDAEDVESKKTDGSAPTDTRGKEGESKVDEDEEELPRGVRRRIDKLTSRNKSTEEENKSLRERLEKLEAKANNTTVTTPTKEDLEPMKKDFRDADEWVKAHGKWAAREVGRENAVKTENEANTAHTQQVFDDHLERVHKFREEQPDFDEKVDASTTTFSESVAIAIVESDNGPAITYHLATHPDELKAIVGLSRARQIMEIGKLSASLSPSRSDDATTTTIRSRTPAPITPIKTTKTATTSTKLEDADTDTYIRLRNQQDRDGRRSRR